MYVVISVVKSESKTSPGTNFAAEDMKENIQAIFIYTNAHFLIEKRNRLEYSKFLMQLKFCPIFTIY